MSPGAEPKARPAPETEGSFGLERYDRLPIFRPEEWNALHALRRRRAGFSAPWSRRTREALGRLETPIHDVLPKQFQFGPSWSQLLAAMHKLRKPYWGWSDATWVEVINGIPPSKNCSRSPLVACAYRLCGFVAYSKIEHVIPAAIVRTVFGAEAFSAEIARISRVLAGLGYSEKRSHQQVLRALAHVMLRQRSPRLEDITLSMLELVRTDEQLYSSARRGAFAISLGLVSLGLQKEHLPRHPLVEGSAKKPEGIEPEWAEWCDRWRANSTLEKRTIGSVYGHLLQVGRWLREKHPEVVSPEQWNRILCAEWVAAVNDGIVGQWVQNRSRMHPSRLGRPFSARTKDMILAHTRVFFHDLQEWDLIQRRFNPYSALETPQAVKRLITRDPRDLDEAIWLKLVWASLNLTEADLNLTQSGVSLYPLAFVRALAVVWTHTAMRSDEIVRVTLGCTKAQDEDILDPETGKALFPAGTLCYVRVPANKSSASFTKPVSGVVRSYILAWEAERPTQPPLLDRKIKSEEHFLFMVRGQRVSNFYINESLIPMLIRKAGIPSEDARGAITSHRGRASAATLLANTHQGMSLLELMQWLGHKTPETTLSYIRVRDPAMARAFASADRSAQLIRVLIDQEAVRNGEAAAGQPWRYYDLGDSYCTYEFWSRCKHRMVCPACTWNVPKSSARGQALEAKQFLMRLLEEVPLTDDEREMIHSGIEVHESIVAKLAHEPTPDGRTPVQIGHQPSPTQLIQLSYSNKPQN